MKKQIAVFTLALGLAASPAMPRQHRGDNTSAACTKMAQAGWHIALARDQGTTEQEGIAVGVSSGFTPNEQFHWRQLVEYVYEQHNDDAPDDVETDYYRDCMSANE